MNGTQNPRLHQRPHVVGILGRILTLMARVLGSIAAAEEAVFDRAVGGEVEDFGLCKELRQDECRSCDYRNVEFDHPVFFCPIISTGAPCAG